MILIIGAWIYYFLLNLSIGAIVIKLISKFTRNDLNLRFGPFYQFWFGFTIVIGLLQALSFVVPINNKVFIILSLLAILSAIFNFKKVWASVNSAFKSFATPRGFLSFLAVCFILLMVSYAANKEVLHSDTFIYHFNGVKWAREYPAVPGLANLHSRLGFNSSFFLFAALTETGFSSGQSSHIALSFLFVACMIHWFFVITNPRELMSKRIFCMVTSVFLILHIVSQIDITSLSTDYPMAIMLLVFCLVLIDKIDHKILLLLPVSAVAFAFKLSGMLTVAFGLIILSGYIFRLGYGKKDRAVRKLQLRSLIVSLMLLGFIVLGFIARNAIVSGWLIFPFPYGNLHLPWSVPKPYVLDLLAWVKSYPLVPGGASPTVISEHDFMWWFTRWAGNFKRLFEFDLFAGSVLILLWTVFQITSFSKFFYSRLNLLFLVLFSVLNILFWFISAPEVRFGSIFFFIFFASSIVLLYETSRYKSILKILIFMLFLHQIVYRLPSYNIDRGPRFFTFAYTRPLELKRTVASPPGEKPEFYIYMPAKGDACGNSPLPCTPYAGGFLHNHRWIRQRVAGDMSKGFLPVE